MLGAMHVHERNISLVESALRAKGVVVVMLKAHVKGPEDVIMAVRAIHAAGYIPEITYRINEGIINEAMTEINVLRSEYVADPLLVGIGSVISHIELSKAIDMGFDMVVSPDNAFEGYGKKIDFVRLAHEANVFSIPGALTPGEFRYFLEGEDDIKPKAIKIFPASLYGPEGLGRMLDPYDRPDYHGIMVVPTGGVNATNGALFQQQITSRGFDVALAMSDPLRLVSENDKTGDLDVIEESLRSFSQRFTPYVSE